MFGIIYIVSLWDWKVKSEVTMQTRKNIFIAFILNLLFSVFELIGGIVTGSVAIASDAVHDMGDAASIGISYFLERKSAQPPDETYTYGYGRFSVLGSLITTAVLLCGSAVMICHSIRRIIQPAPIHYDGMIVFALVGVCVNFCAAWFTRDGDSLNQKAVNLHMLEDVLGWVVVLMGALVMRFTDFALIDPAISIGVSCFILIHAVRNLKEIAAVFLEKIPHGLEVEEITEHVKEIDGVLDVHHVHLWSMDGQTHCATLHVVTDSDAHTVKENIRRELMEHGIGHVTIETETGTEHCSETTCTRTSRIPSAHCHHHHGHSH